MQIYIHVSAMGIHFTECCGAIVHLLRRVMFKLPAGRELWASTGWLKKLWRDAAMTHHISLDGVTGSFQALKSCKELHDPRSLRKASIKLILLLMELCYFQVIRAVSFCDRILNMLEDLPVCGDGRLHVESEACRKLTSDGKKNDGRI